MNTYISGLGLTHHQAISYKNELADEIRAKVINVTTNFTQEYKRSKNADKCLLLLVNRTKKYLADNKQIVVINADKGKKTIITNRSEYDAGMEKLVSDSDTYTKTRRDPTIRIETQVNDLVTSWRLNNKIDDEKERYMKTHNSVAPAVYGLGKLHKKKPGETMPLRPVVCTIQSPTYKISQMLAKVFGDMTIESPYHVKDSWQFANDIKNVKIPSGYKLISLDATSLFTNIPTSLCVTAIKNRWSQIKPHTFLTQKQFIEVVRLITSESYFRYKDDFYLQQCGLAMGNAISGFLADMVMEDLEKKALRNLPFDTPFYKRYVDDIIVAIPENESETIRNEFNKHHKRLKFTIEEEAGKQINFLDMTLMRSTSGEITTKWYQKEIASGRYLHFDGHNPMTHKRNVATAITDRAIAFTNPVDRPKSLLKVNELLAENGYPKPFVSKIIKNRVERFYNGKPNIEKPKQRFIASPYVPGLSERLKKVLSQYDLTLSCKTTNKIGDLYTRMKTDSAKGAWDALCNHHKKATFSTKIRLLRKLYHEILPKNGNMEEHLSKLTEYYDDLCEIDHVIDDQQFVSIVMTSVGEDYDGLITALDCRDENDLTFDLVQSKLMDEYERKKKVDDFPFEGESVSVTVNLIASVESDDDYDYSF
ncbi:uncharacterized protein LOC119066056 [Bradysia coprophila]|uniref:uncharacterized protein LOC119066056 n=1 Tax=Bradysia coprophila TaxID=38358 RepID=UPI00187D731C|nr:uncharacterized protein LOC119066056 [Bradysia coprophila]